MITSGKIRRRHQSSGKLLDNTIAGNADAVANAVEEIQECTDRVWAPLLTHRGPERHQRKLCDLEALQPERNADDGAAQQEAVYSGGYGQRNPA